MPLRRAASLLVLKRLRGDFCELLCRPSGKLVGVNLPSCVIRLAYTRLRNVFPPALRMRIWLPIHPAQNANTPNQKEKKTEEVVVGLSV